MSYSYINKKTGIRVKPQFIKKPYHKQFTYGFELEGSFSYPLVSKLQTYAAENKLHFVYKTDGSVYCNHSVFAPTRYSELNLGVFKSYDSMMKVMAMFDRENYFSNTTCGLHIHIKPKYYWNREKLEDMFWSYEFVKKMQVFADTKLCNCQHVRLNSLPGEHYAPNHKNFADMRNNFHRRTKFIFVGKHPSGTYEFRFFSPCEHMIENVNKFFKFAFYELEHMTPDKSRRAILMDGTSKDIAIGFNLHPMKKDLNIFCQVEARKLSLTL